VPSQAFGFIEGRVPPPLTSLFPNSLWTATYDGPFQIKKIEGTMTPRHVRLRSPLRNTVHGERSRSMATVEYVTTVPPHSKKRAPARPRSFRRPRECRPRPVPQATSRPWFFPKVI